MCGPLMHLQLAKDALLAPNPSPVFNYSQDPSSLTYPYKQCVSLISLPDPICGPSYSLSHQSGGNLAEYYCVYSLCKFTAALGLESNHFPPCQPKKGPKITAKLLNSLGDLAHTVDERFVLAYPVDSLALVVPPREERQINWDYLLAQCCPPLKTIKRCHVKAQKVKQIGNVGDAFQPTRQSWGNYLGTLQRPWP
ncbi:hypothetical protein DSO57_1009496 [Entomophthora muscae]|uniref:Uncharacterized protein n=1 Tax=Entomophthora muscae TaxID=34485 RepID=A0ACC2UGI5_9FUNG|nr:hypothetical protein DSO57_1009496 [Entomophthora muscae]